jgi:23S rRNA (guanosine2251-2'-O)-methyltransferase
MYTSSFLPKRENNQLVFGIRAVIEAIKSGQEMESIYIQRGLRGELFHELRELMNEYQLSAQLVPVEKLNGLTRANHQGVVAFASLVKYMDLQQVIDFVVGEGQTPLFLMLDGITDVRNIGASARSAVCCGAQALIIPDKGVGALQEEALKSSAGALEWIHICRVSSLLKAVDTLHLNGIQVFTSEMRAEKGVSDIVSKLGGLGI